MATDFIQRQIQRLLSQAEEALDRGDWAAIKEAGNKLVALDPGNRDASALLAAAERVSSSTPASATAASDVATQEVARLASALAHPTSFASGRYAVRRFLGEG